MLCFMIFFCKACLKNANGIFRILLHLLVKVIQGKLFVQTVNLALYFSNALSVIQIFKRFANSVRMPCEKFKFTNSITESPQ